MPVYQGIKILRYIGIFCIIKCNRTFTIELTNLNEIYKILTERT